MEDFDFDFDWWAHVVVPLDVGGWNIPSEWNAPTETDAQCDERQAEVQTLMALGAEVHQP